MDIKFRIPRVWSNNELKKFAHLFSGKICNVSGWKDIDKQGKKYKDYFTNLDEYWITNFKSDARGFQGDTKNEIFLDLEKDLDKNLIEKFDVTFNHTVLEHIFNINKAFSNLCKMSKDIVIVIVPFLQEQHAIYGDYWRFTPLAIKKMFEQNNLEMIYVNFNDAKHASIYIFAIGSKNPNKHKEISNHRDNKLKDINNNFMLGTKAYKNNFFSKLKAKLEMKRQ